MTADHRHPCRMIWDLAGQPTPADKPSGDGPCALCGATGTLHAKLGANFTDYRKLSHVDGTHLCASCSWVLSGKPPATLRMWTLVARLDWPAPPSQPTAYVSGEFLHATNRKDMRWVAATLADPPADGAPWLVAVAESGQKHTAPFTPLNRGADRWTVCLDGSDVTSTPEEWRRILAHTAALRHAGFSAQAIESGQPPIVALAGEKLAAWREHHPHLATYVDTTLLHLANLMITKETVDDYLATYPTR